MRFRPKKQSRSSKLILPARKLKNEKVSAKSNIKKQNKNDCDKNTETKKIHY